MNEALSRDEQTMDAASGIAEEAGEVLAHVRKHQFQGRELDAARLKEELGDVLWCIAAVATSAGFELDDVAQFNLEKLRHRHAKVVAQ
jgi:NTP pyrophosphatase (non-canonical NTP hydrolase)